MVIQDEGKLLPPREREIIRAFARLHAYIERAGRWPMHAETFALFALLLHRCQEALVAAATLDEQRRRYLVSPTSRELPEEQRDWFERASELAERAFPHLASPS